VQAVAGVLVEGLAVIADNDDDGVVEQAPGPVAVDELSHDDIGEAEAVLVAVDDGAGAEGSRRVGRQEVLVVRDQGHDDVQGGPPRGRALVEPAEGLLDDDAVVRAPAVLPHRRAADRQVLAVDEGREAPLAEEGELVGEGEVATREEAGVEAGSAEHLRH
jgi:hypothetical protein